MKKPPKTMQQLKVTQKRRIAEWLYAAILKSMAETGAKPDEAAILQLATGVQQRFQALRVAYTLEEAQQYVEKRIERDCERAAQELEQRKPLTEQVKIPAQGAMRERAQWAQSFPREIGTGNALIILISIKNIFYPLALSNAHDGITRKVVDCLAETVYHLFQCSKYLIAKSSGS